MNNKCNKKLLSSILVALSLSSGISINDKIANANYKDEDRTNLNELVSSINDSKESEVAQNLFNAINGIYQNRCQHNKNSVLYKSMQANMKLSPDDVDISKYKQYGPDALKAMILELGVDKFKGGHFTVWNEQIKNYVNNALEQINCCDAWFWALGGSQKDIDEYKKLISKDYDKCEKAYVIDRDVPRTWADAKKYDLNVKEKEKVLRRVLKIYDLDKGNYTQGFNFWCMYIIDKPVGCKNKEISPETEAKIYYVYKTIMDTMCEISSDMAKNYSVESKKSYLQFLNAFARDHKNLKLPNELDILNKVSQDKIKVDKESARLIEDHAGILLPNVMAVCDSFLPTRNLKIKLLDEIIYAGAFKKGCKEIVVQKIADKFYEFIINHYKEIETISKSKKFSVFLGVASLNKEEQLNYNLQFSNDI